MKLQKFFETLWGLLVQQILQHSRFNEHFKFKSSSRLDLDIFVQIKAWPIPRRRREDRAPVRPCRRQRRLPLQPHRRDSPARHQPFRSAQPAQSAKRHRSGKLESHSEHKRVSLPPLWTNDWGKFWCVWLDHCINKIKLSPLGDKQSHV